MSKYQGISFIKIYPPHRTTINQALAKSNKLTKTWYITSSKLIVDNQDLEEVEKVLNRLETPFKL